MNLYTVNTPQLLEGQFPIHSRSGKKNGNTLPRVPRPTRQLAALGPQDCPGVQIVSWGVFSNYSARAELFFLAEKLMTSCSDEEDWDGRAAANSSLVTLPIQL